tara:strand:- start:155 stop:556 length:402 start_codon:yes stop_codon:yes gene_type:complete
MQEIFFKRLILSKIAMFVLIIIWGGSVQISGGSNSEVNDLSYIRDVLFALFSVSYFFVSYKLYKFKNIGKKLFMPLVLVFIVLGFLGEFFNPLEIEKDLFYLFIFYIVSPLFFVAQGIVAGLLYFSQINVKFS